MKKIKIHCCNSTNTVGSYDFEESEVEVKDNATKKEINKIAADYYDAYMSNFDTGVSWEFIGTVLTND